MIHGPHIIYVEQAVEQHVRTETVLQHFPEVPRFRCQHYGEVFNRSAQSFRLQKRQPALILAQKQAKTLLPAPPGYGIGGRYNYYFSHLLNCPYDCRYCFLQGKYRSAHHVLFVNYETFAEDIAALCHRHAGQSVHFFSGYDGDSLALDPLSGFVDYFLPLFRTLSNGLLELRSKSTQVRSLLRQEAMDNVVLAWSFTPDVVARALEHRVPSLEKRIRAISKLQDRGWSIGLRFDPLIYTAQYRVQYEALFDALFSHLREPSIHSVSIGSFRLPKSYFETVRRMYPEEPLFAVSTSERFGVVGFKMEQEQEMLDWCLRVLRTRIPAEKLFPCLPSGTGAGTSTRMIS